MSNYQEANFDNIDSGNCRDQVNDFFTQLLDHAVEHGHVAGARTLTVTIEIKPNVQTILKATGENKVIVSPEINWKAKRSFPSVKGSQTVGFVHESTGKVLVNTAHPEDPTPDMLDQAGVQVHELSRAEDN